MRRISGSPLLNILLNKKHHLIKCKEISFEYKFFTQLDISEQKIIAAGIREHEYN